VEQELHILPEHPSFWAIKKLCSFSWTFPENSRRPGGFYFYMMFMIPEVLVRSQGLVFRILYNFYLKILPPRLVYRGWYF
jgi:hypothetical protein